MSAFVVHDDHLRLLAQAGVQWLRITDPGKVVADLFQLNSSSVAHRYRDPVEAVEPPKFVEVVSRLDPLVVMKAILCFQYQSDELPEHRDHPAWTFTEQLLSASVRQLPGYEDAAGWCFVRGAR